MNQSASPCSLIWNGVHAGLGQIPLAQRSLLLLAVRHGFGAKELAAAGASISRLEADLTERGNRLFHALVKDAAEQGYGEYRTHLSYMDEVAGTYSFNDHALRRFNETLKDAVDPNGILSPGRGGIWPKAHRSRRGAVRK